MFIRAQHLDGGCPIVITLSVRLLLVSAKITEYLLTDFLQILSVGTYCGNRLLSKMVDILAYLITSG